MSGFFRTLEKDFKWGEIVIHAKIDLLDSFSLKKISRTEYKEEEISIENKESIPDAPTHIETSNNEYLFYDDIIRCDFILNKHQEN